MRKFLDSIDSCIFILDKNSNIIFCNKKVLNKFRCSKSEIHNLKVKNLNLSKNQSIKDIIKNITEDDEINIDLRIISDEVEIEFKSVLVNSIFEEKEVVFVSSNDFKLINYKEKVENITLEKNLELEIQKSENLINKLKIILDKLEKNISIDEIISDNEKKEITQQILGELYTNELLRKELDLIFSISADLAGVLDKEGYLKTTGQAWTDYLGWSEEEFLNCNVLDLIYEEYKDKFKDILKVEDESLNVIENKIKCKDGSFKWLRWNFKFVKERNLFAFIIRDITKEKEEEKQRKKLEEVIYFESIKNQFFSNMSHEFKTPLNIILGTIQLIEKNSYNIDKETCEFIDINRYIKLIKQNSYRLLRLVNNLIDMTKIENGYYEIKLGNYNIVSVVEDIVLSVAQYVEGKGIELIFDTNVEEYIIACDPEKIERILLNLLSNSIKYTKKDGYIYVNLIVDDKNINISVKDNGTGISKDKLPIIFNRYVQGDNNLTRTCEGSGIGLSLVKSLVEIHGGEIEAKSEEGIGTCIEFYLPNKITLSTKDEIQKNSKSENNNIEICNIEFSDIYGI